MRFCYAVTFLAACLAAAVLFFGLIGAKGAPQEAAIGAIALAIAVIPYVFSRCVEKLGPSPAEEIAKLAKLLVPPPPPADYGREQRPCPACGVTLPLAADRCRSCGAALADSPDWRRLRAQSPARP